MDMDVQVMCMNALFYVYCYNSDPLRQGDKKRQVHVTIYVTRELEKRPTLTMWKETGWHGPCIYLSAGGYASQRGG